MITNLDTAQETQPVQVGSQPESARTDSDFSALLRDTAIMLAKLINVDFGGYGEVIDSTSSLILTLAYDNAGSNPDHHVWPLDATDSMAVSSVCMGEPVVVTDLPNDSTFADSFLVKRGVVSALTVPLQVVYKPLGALAVYSTRQREFLSEDIRFVKATARSLTSLIARYQMEMMLRDVTPSAPTFCATAQSQQNSLIESGLTEEEKTSIRSTVRREYHYCQRIAPVYGEERPSQDAFFEVTCKNISAGGLAFFMETKPDFDKLVVAVGFGSSITYFNARVAHVAEQQHNGQKLFAIGVAFTGRTNID